MTAHALQEERDRCSAVGMNDFITKPIDPDKLCQTLLKHRRTALQENTPANAVSDMPAKRSATPIPDLPGIDIEDGLRRMMNKTALYERVLRDFHTRFRDEAKIIRQTLESGEHTTAERRAHSSKGLAGTIGALALQDAARELEIALRNGSDDIEHRLTEFATQLEIVIAGIAQGFQIHQKSAAASQTM